MRSNGQLGGSWLRHLIVQCIDEAQAKVTPDEVESRLAKKIKAKLLEGKLGGKEKSQSIARDFPSNP